MAALCRSGEPNPGLLLGAAIGELALAGRDKLTLLASPELASLPDWLEQLIAESLGKQGKGVVPIAGEGEAPPGANTEDRFFVGLSLDGGDTEAVAPRLERARAAGHPTAVLRLGERLQIGAEMLRWEIATAACGALLGVHPFDQPDVQAAKDAAQKAMRRPEETAGGVEVVAVDAAELRQRLEVFLGGLSAGDYVGVQAFLEPGPSARPVRELRSALWRRTGVAVTAGHGPRFLHSTGQLHKGGPGTGRFLQLVDRPATDVPIPGSDVTFGRLIRAQAAGDAEALAGRGRKVLVVDLGAQGPVGIQRLLDALG
jgi:transaldolase/glucose-6-phosphate isomerase